MGVFLLMGSIWPFILVSLVGIKNTSSENRFPSSENPVGFGKNNGIFPKDPEDL